MAEPRLLRRRNRWYSVFGRSNQTLRAWGKISREKAEEHHERFLETWEAQRDRIDNKMEKLRRFKRMGGIPYSIWDFPDRGDGGDRSYHGNTSPKVIEQCVKRFTKPGDLVIDPMAGSGTTWDVCKRLNRRCVVFDLYPHRPEIQKADTTQEIPIHSDEEAQLVFWHPPYWGLVPYGKNRKDLSNAPTVEAWVDEIRGVLRNCIEILSPGGHIAVQVGDVVKEGFYYPLCHHVIQAGQDLGLEHRGVAIKVAHGDRSRKKSGMLVAEYIWAGFLKISHDQVIFFRRR